MGSQILGRPATALRAQSALYLLSAFMVLLGGYLSLHDLHGRPTTVALPEVFGTQIAYQAALVAVIAILYRVRGQVADTLLLLRSEERRVGKECRL